MNAQEETRAPSHGERRTEETLAAESPSIGAHHLPLSLTSVTDGQTVFETEHLPTAEEQTRREV